MILGAAPPRGNGIVGPAPAHYVFSSSHYSFASGTRVASEVQEYPPVMNAPTMTRYVRYEEISFVRASGAGYQEEASMMRRARAEIESGSLQAHEQIESVEVWGCESYRPGPRQRAADPGARPLTLYWYRATITGSTN